MKRIVVLSFFIIFIANAFAQNISQGNVPAVVLNAFKLRFSNATDVKWKLEKGSYLVDFEVNNKDNKLVMSDRGKLIKYEQDLYVSEIPKAVLETIKSRVEFFDVNDADRIEDGGKVSYKVNFEVNGKDHDFLIDERGKLLRYIKELRESEVPLVVMNAAKTTYNDYEIRDADLTEEGGNVTYTLQMRKSHEKIFVIISSGGKIIKAGKG